MPRCDYCRDRLSAAVLLQSGVVLCLQCYGERQEELPSGVDTDDPATDWLSESTQESEEEEHDPRDEHEEPEAEPEPQDPTPKRQRTS